MCGMGDVFYFLLSFLVFAVGGVKIVVPQSGVSICENGWGCPELRQMIVWVLGRLGDIGHLAS